MPSFAVYRLEPLDPPAGKAGDWYVIRPIPLAVVEGSAIDGLAALDAVPDSLPLNGEPYVQVAREPGCVLISTRRLSTGGAVALVEEEGPPKTAVWDAPGCTIGPEDTSIIP